MRSGAEISKGTASYTTLTYLTLFGLAIAVPLLLLLGVLLFQSASTQRQQLEDRVLQVVSALVNDVDRDVDRHIAILHTLATSQSLAMQDWRAFYDQAKAALQGRAYLILVDADGRQLVNTYVPYGEQPAMTGDPETVRRMLETRAPVVSNLFVSLVVKNPVFNVSIPVSLNSQFRFVMSLGLLPDDLALLLASQKLGPEWVTMIWDANGVVLARSRDNARHLGTKLPQNLREQDRQTVVRTTNLDGADVLHATARSQISGWSVGVNVPYALITEQMRTSLLLWGTAAVLAIAIAVGLGWRFARQITMPLSVASSAAGAFGRGQPFPITGSHLKEADAFLTTLKTAQQELQDRSTALKSAEEQFRLAVEAAPNGMILADNDGQIVLVNAQVEKLFGYSRAELVGRKVEMLVPERFRGRHTEDRRSYMAHPITRAMGVGRDLSGLRKDGGEFPVEVGLNPISQNGRTGVMTTIIDISERVRAQDQQKFLIRELQHRTQNLFAVVHSIVARSLVEGQTIKEAREALKGRLTALAQAHTLLAEAAWKGAPLAEIIKRECGSFFELTSVSGCDIMVNARAAHQFALIIHELTTNAFKYGALSVPQGRISIKGDIDKANGEAMFSFLWTERGGPMVSQPTRKGFGSVILLDAAKQFGQHVAANYEPHGFSYELHVPMHEIEISTSEIVVASAAASATSATP